MEIKTVGVVGCGLMGSGIAEQAAKCGYELVVREVDDELLDRGKQRILASMKRAVDRGKLTTEDHDAAWGRIRGTTSLSDFAGCDIVIEAAVENLDLKKAVFVDLDRITRPDVILCSNTSSVSITALASVTG